ncbi:MAG: magnesium transporter CorA family protein [Minisyncoccia bacterium]
MITRHKYRGETWIDIDSGTSEEIHKLMDEYNIHPFVAKELTSVTPKPRIEFHDKYVYCILHFPAWKHTHESNHRNQEVDFIISRDVLITARYDTIDALHRFSKDLEVEEILDKQGDMQYGHSHHLFMNMLRGLYNGLFEELAYIDDMTENITSKIFKGKEREMVIKISEVTRTLLNFKRVTDLHQEILEALKHRGEEIFGKEFSNEVESIILEYLKINTTIRSNLEVLHELRDTNNSLLTTKQNEIVKQLTVLGFVILPLNLIAWMFAMRVDGLPFLNNPNGFLIVLVIMIASASIALAYAKHKKWL